MALFDFPESPKLGESSLGDPCIQAFAGKIIKLNEPQVGLLVCWFVGLYKVVPRSIAKLVNITPITMVYL